MEFRAPRHKGTAAMIELLGEKQSHPKSRLTDGCFDASLCACRFHLSEEESSFSVEATNTYPFT